MWNKILAVVTVIIAVVLAILAVLLKPEDLRSVIVFSRFFEVMIPILAVGALLKYLTYCPKANVWNWVVPGVAILIAVIIAILAISLPTARLDFVIFVSRFFEIMLPILAVGALLKYLTRCEKVEA